MGDAHAGTFKAYTAPNDGFVVGLKYSDNKAFSDYTNDTYTCHLNFDAYRLNSMYSSATVRPKSMIVQYLIKY